jgi:anhydro-N-acetylmuramic acid kinase
MVYRVIGLMSGSSLDGLDIAFASFQETSGKWQYELKASACLPYGKHWKETLSNAHNMSAVDYQLCHASYGRFIGEQVNHFIEANGLDYQVQLIASHGHTVFHMPQHHMTTQLGEGAQIAALTGINVVSDLRSMDVALGGQGAPIVPIGEKLLLSEYDMFLNIGGIANISYNSPDKYIAFDVCPANRVLNLLSKQLDHEYDEDGKLASEGKILDDLLNTLNHLEYYSQPYPKSLANNFGTETIFPILHRSGHTKDLLRTYVEHIAIQVSNSLGTLIEENQSSVPKRILVTGGGAHNQFLISRLKELAKVHGVEIVVPDNELIDFKEAIIMGLIGLLRWREENNVFSSVTGAIRNSIGGAVWIGQDA